MRILACVLWVPLFLATATIVRAETAADIATRNLLDALEDKDKGMPDVSLMVLEQVLADPTASPELKKEVPFRRAAALVAASRAELDSKKRAAVLDNAQQSLDAFLSSGGVSDRQAISAYTQKGNLLIERGRSKADQANRPGSDVKALRAEALKFFDEAIKSLEGTAKPGQEIKAVTNAEDAVIKVLREVTENVKELNAAIDQGAASQPIGGGGANASREAAIRTAGTKARAARDAAAAATAAQQFAAQALANVNAANAAAQAGGGKNKAANQAVTQATAAQVEANKVAAAKVAAAQAAAAEAEAAKKAVVEATAAAKANNAANAGEKQPEAKPGRSKAQLQKDLEALTEDQEALQAKLIQTRLMTAAALFEKAKAYDAKSKEWTDVVTKSAEKFKDIADKYPAKGGGLYARYYEGRNYALLEKHDLAFNTLSYLASLDQKMPLAYFLRSRALNTTLECFIALKKYDGLDDSGRKFALEDVARLQGAKLDSDWLGLKYRAAVILDARAAAIDPKDAKSKAERSRLVTDAKKLAVEVAKANLDFSNEARALAAKLGKEVTDTTEQTFATFMDEANLALGTMQGLLVPLKSEKDPAKIAEIKAAVAPARQETIAKLAEAMKFAGITDPFAADSASDDALKSDATIEQINHARYLMTYLLYESQRFEESAALGRLLVDRYPRAKGSTVAAKVAMSALQQLSQKSEGPARDEARAKLNELATNVMRIWPDDTVGADAASIVISAAVAARDPAAMVAILDKTSPSSPRRNEILLRAGSALYREVQDARRNTDAATRPADAVIDGWKKRAREALDEALAGATTLPEGPLGTLTAAGALSRVQVAMDDDDMAKALAILEQPAYGPWTLVTANNPIMQQGSLAEASLTLALRLFIQAEKFEQAQEAMDALEKMAGTGEEASAKLTSMYLNMGRDLQSQLERLGGPNANDPKVRAQAQKILGGFEKFLDRVASRDTKISSQFWVATTYLTLGSGQGTGAIVPKDKAARYLERSAAVYGKLIGNVDDPEVAKFEPSIRLRMASIYQELRQWDEAQKQMDWFLSDKKRQNSLETQIQAAKLLQAAAADAATNGDAAKADTLYREAAGGRKAEPVIIWGWGAIANKVSRRLTGDGEQARQARDAFFSARVKAAECLLARARLPGKEKEKMSRLGTAETIITMTYQAYPDLGGPESFAAYDNLLKQVQQEKGGEPKGLAGLKAPAAPPPPAAAKVP